MTRDNPVLVVDDHAVMGHALATALVLQGFERSRALPADRLTDDEVLTATADALARDAGWPER